MLSLKGLNRPISLLLVVMICNSCAMIGDKPSQEVYYTTPPVTFLREFPRYDSPNGAAVYRGEQVVILSRQADDWCQVQSVPSGKAGWIQSPLLSAGPISTPTYVVQANKVQLRDTPRTDATSPEVLQRGDKVRKLTENQAGWWFVQVEKDHNVGWVPATTLSEPKPENAPPAQAAGVSGQGSAKGPAKQLYYVATANLNLRSLPLVSSQVVNTLKFNDRVEKIDQSDSRWLKVRYPVTGAQGWAQGIFFADASLKAPRVFSQPAQTKRTTPRRSVCPKPAEPEQTQPEEVEPVVM